MIGVPPFGVGTGGLKQFVTHVVNVIVIPLGASLLAYITVPLNPQIGGNVSVPPPSTSGCVEVFDMPQLCVGVGVGVAVPVGVGVGVGTGEGVGDAVGRCVGVGFGLGVGLGGRLCTGTGATADELPLVLHAADRPTAMNAVVR
jgi:hypothetical protein